MREWLRRHSGTLYLFLVVYLAGAATNLVYTSHAIHRANIALAASIADRATIVQLCQEDNAVRYRQRALWAYVLHLFPPPSTVDAQALLAQFEEHLAVVTRSRDCASIQVTR